MAQKRHPASRRGGPRKDETPDDTFIAWTLQIWTWIEKNAQIVVLAVVIGGLGIAGTVYYVNFRSSVESEASSRLEQLAQMVQSGLTGEAVTQLRSFIDRFSDTRQADEARLMLGEIHLRNGRAEEAVPVLEPLARNLDQPLGIQGGFLLASAYEELDRDGEAETLYLDLANSAELDFRIRDALASAARIRMERGDYAAAAELYRELVETTPEDEDAHGRFEMRLAEALAMADEGGGS